MGLPDRIPDEQLPQCWYDDVRMNALFAPFRLRTANPESWNMKMKFWSDMLRQWCKYKRDPVVSAADAKVAFQRNGRTPACLEIVFEEMMQSGELAPLSKYQHILHSGPEGWVRWGARLAFKPAAFALTAVTSLIPGRQLVDNDGLPKANIDVTQRFVVESVVREQATDFLNNYPPGVERVGSVDELMKNTQWNGSRETFQVILGYLVSQGSAVNKGEVVKIGEPNKKAGPVSESDEALVRLVSAERRLQAEAARTARDVTLSDADARAALKIGNRLAAKNHLRRKHKLQQRLDKCESALENVQQLLLTMRESDVNRDILDTYKISSQAMRRGMQESGVNEDSVHDTMDELREVMDSYNEIEKALSSTTDDSDVNDLEQELRELMNDAGGSGGTPGKEKKTVTVVLPTPPRETPLPAQNLPSPPRQTPGPTRPNPGPTRRKISEREFIFDGEANLIAELNELGIDPAQNEQSKEPMELPTVINKAWYPPAEDWGNNNLDTSLNNLADGVAELRMDERLHPGQPLNVDFHRSTNLYSTEFQVRDHKIDSGVWLYNSRDPAGDTIDSDDATANPFMMAPGSGRRKPSTSEDQTTEDLETRLRNLRGFNS